jgi:tyrosyl-tRNA synthetase
MFNSKLTANFLQLTPQLLKAALTSHLNTFLKPIRDEYLASPEWQAIDLAAYPPAQAAVKVKKVKDKGDPAKRAAAAAAKKGLVANADGSLTGPEAEKASVAGGESAEETLKKLHVTE